jgi:lipoprotein-releasing system permease protein
LKLAWFITRRLASSPNQAFSARIIRIATAAIALSMAVMIIASALVRGFQQTIGEKVYGFMGHVLVTQLDTRNQGRSYEELPVEHQQPFLQTLPRDPGVRHIQTFARKAGIIKSAQNIEGIIVRGIGPDFDQKGFERFLVEGQLPDASAEQPDPGLLISRSTQQRLGFRTGDPVPVFFIDQTEAGKFRQRAREFRVSGVYHTGLEEYDRLFALADLRHIRRINGWSDTEVGGFEIYLHDASDPRVLEAYTEMIDYEAGPFLRVANLRQLEPNIFDWLNLQSQNEQIIMTLMMLVAIINMVTSLLILILERTHMIGVLKALGARDWTIRRIFLWNAVLIIGRGLLWGNLIGIGLCLMQAQFGIIRLPEESYYVSVAPVDLQFGRILLLNLMTLVVCTAFLVLPSWLATRVHPVQALRFD